ncbi:hypothetical protein [Burkholderia seminalis]|uniref:hypothetical protein n=1 Tax=Burkholderia seminalis TaxID=488731 RepID=UPI00084F5EF5|nr:hypothetical protein [Burkholderia seminalis]MDN7849956.1 hypothetical protein [Burkholderia seminalis]
MSEVRKKSPRAPTLALPDALDRVEKIYAQEGRHATPAEIIAQALGYKSATNGSAAQAIASLRYYGLLERPKDGVLAVAKDYENYKYSPGEPLKQAYLIGWLRAPAVFATLLDKYENRLPSDANIRFDLINMGFIPAGADAYVSAFRRSVEFARFYDQDRGPQQGDDVGTPEISGTTELPLEQPDLASAPPQSPAQPQHSWGQLLQSNAHMVSNIPQPTTNDPDVIRVPVRLPKGRCAWLELPIPFYEADKERLKAYIDMQLADDADAE